MLLEGAKAHRVLGKGFEMHAAYFHLKPTANTVHRINSVVLRNKSASCKLEKSVLCLVNERLREMLLNGGSGGSILEAKGSY